MRSRSDRLVVDPRLPTEWNALEIALRFHGRPLRLRIDRNEVSTISDGWVVEQAPDHWEVTPS
jgi:cellobiose phosphorylase